MSKANEYQEITSQIDALLAGETDLIANLANCCAVLHQTFNFHWTGFYLVKDSQLVLGPFQGPVACTRIGFGKGVCGLSWKKAEILIVEDVHKFEGHIACSPFSNSEIVVPLIIDGKVWAVLDIDSTEFAAFDETDAKYLDKVCKKLTSLIQNSF
jgi:L-methionine (R)-S-oxide reductase